MYGDLNDNLVPSFPEFLLFYFDDATLLVLLGPMPLPVPSPSVPPTTTTSGSMPYAIAKS